MILTQPALQAAAGCSPARAIQWLDPLKLTAALFSIDTPERLAMFLAQIGHESGRLVYVRELWGPTPAQQRYEGRVDLGNQQAGDGKRFMGRGLLQVTGRRNYATTRDNLRQYAPGVPDFEQQPEQLEQPIWAAMSAGLYWHDRKLNDCADAGDFDGCSDLINRGHKTAAVGDSNGYADRLALWKAGKAALGLA